MTNPSRLATIRALVRDPITRLSLLMNTFQLQRGVRAVAPTNESEDRPPPSHLDQPSARRLDSTSALTLSGSNRQPQRDFRRRYRQGARRPICPSTEIARQPLVTVSGAIPDRIQANRLQGRHTSSQSDKEESAPRWTSSRSPVSTAESGRNGIPESPPALRHSWHLFDAHPLRWLAVAGHRPPTDPRPKKARHRSDPPPVDRRTSPRPILFGAPARA